MARKERINPDGSIDTTKTKKPFYKKTWFIVIVALILIGTIGNALGGDDDKNVNPVVSEQQVKPAAEQPPQTEADKKAEEERKAEEQRLADQKKAEEDAKKAEEEARRAEEEAAKAAEEAKKIKAGSYRVGNDIPAGEYKIYSNGFTYMEVAKDSSGTLDSIVTNDNVTTFRYITVQDGQYLSFNDGYALAIADVKPHDSADGYGDGQYLVGFDIPAGEYNVLSDGFCYVEVASSSTGDLYSIVTNDNFDTNKFITVADGQYLTIRGGKIEE